MSKSSIQIFEGLNLEGIYFFKAPSRKILSKCLNNKYCQFIVILSGSYKAYPENKKADIVAGPGDIIFWYAGEKRVEENDLSNPTKCFSIYFEWPNPVISLPNCCKDRTLLISRLSEILLEIKGISYMPDLIRPLSNAYLTAIVAEYIRSSQLNKDPLVNEVAKYVEEHMSEPIKLADLAKHVGLEAHHFGRKYKALTGHTPMYDVKHRKIEHAKGMLLLKPYRTLANIAERVGIRDAFRLSRLISRYTGLSAREIRKQHKLVSKFVKKTKKRNHAFSK